jgi:hypothetical protein
MGNDAQAHSLIQTTSALGKALSIIDRSIDFKKSKKIFDESLSIHTAGHSSLT